MSSILLVTSSPRGEASLSSRVARELAEKLSAARPGSRLVARDLAREPLPHIDPHFAAGIYTAQEARTPEQARAVAISDQAVDELLEAEAIVIAAAMINFSIPSTLKSWFDHVARAGRTFRYTEKGPEGLVKGRKAYLVLASGGVYSQGASAAFDHAVPYMKSFLAFLGISDVEVIRVEGVALSPDAAQQAVSQALGQASQYALAA
ncbi:FMN-dependent NADH-azoreductase [Chelativorans intermedius]|uniref:FMN dependent NADH:quinone oxidoreductase n=1 Tax=Chelativorans intermedius TaxID=515947 RepID=A0ABV6D9J4_9HYPH|nr:FMN-dependent NADH-azoreductase [Chelativorans intermedius]MCT8998569.1 FMN-dependent NADH-azoreductase [Chelativorans intermedius]